MPCMRYIFKLHFMILNISKSFFEGLAFGFYTSTVNDFGFQT